MVPVIDSGLVSVRFTSARATLTGAHYAGVLYHVPPAFAQLVVEQERVAVYAEDAPAGEEPQKKKRKG